MGFYLYSFIVLFLWQGATAKVSHPPVVLMHGLLASAEAMSHAESWIKEDYPGIYVKNVEIGNGRSDSLLLDINFQVHYFAELLANDTNLRGGFNLIGHSQGALISRAYIERFNNPPVINYISWVGPHDGVFGVPDFNYYCPDSDYLCDLLNYAMNDIVEDPSITWEIQGLITFAAYWKDPLNYQAYLLNNNFLADINNERAVNATYKKNMLSLKKVLLIYSTTDKIVIPLVSPWFSFFKIGHLDVIEPFESSEQYTKDLLGLRTLYETKRLIMESIPCGHQDVPREDCKEWYTKYTKPLLA